jgi:hypothetical protein
MFGLLAKNREVLRALTQERRVPSLHVWHLWTVTIPRRSITGRLLWGTVWRRRDSGRWIYKQYVESWETVQNRRSVRTLISNSRVHASEAKRPPL